MCMQTSLRGIRDQLPPHSSQSCANRPDQKTVSNTSLPTGIPNDAICSMTRWVPQNDPTLRICRITSALSSMAWSMILSHSMYTQALLVVPGSIAKSFMRILLIERVKVLISRLLLRHQHLAAGQEVDLHHRVVDWAIPVLACKDHVF